MALILVTLMFVCLCVCVCLCICAVLKQSVTHSRMFHECFFEKKFEALLCDLIIVNSYELNEQKYKHIDVHLVSVLLLCLPQVWAAIPPWKQGSLAEFVVLSANEVCSSLGLHRCFAVVLLMLQQTSQCKFEICFFLHGHTCN